MSRSLLLSLGAAFIYPSFATAEVSTPRQVADRPAAHCQSPRWSPDGKQLAYDVYDPKRDAREIWIVHLDDGNRMEQVRVAGSSGRLDKLKGKSPPVVELEWAPDMKLLNKPYIFSSMGTRRNFDLYADGQWMTTNPGNDGQPAWSPDGRFIAFTSQQRNSGDIFLLDLGGDSDKPKRVTSWPNMTELRPRWSPRQNQLAFTRSQSGKRGQDIGICDDVTKPKESMRMITDWAADEIRPSWSPDGKSIAFYSNKGRKDKKLFDLWVIGSDGKDAKQLAKDVIVDDHLGPAWTPDSSTILFVRRDYKANNPIRWVRKDGTANGVLDTGTQINSDLSIAADKKGLRLAFRALGQTGSTNKTWQRLYIVSFAMDDLKGE